VTPLHTNYCNENASSYMMQPIAIDVAKSVCASVCHKMAKLIKVRAGLWTRKGPRVGSTFPNFGRHLMPECKLQEMSGMSQSYSVSGCSRYCTNLLLRCRSCHLSGRKHRTKHKAWTGWPQSRRNNSQSFPGFSRAISLLFHSYCNKK